MKMDSEQYQAALAGQVAHAWRIASSHLGIKIVSPYTIELDRKSADCIAFLPDFGSSQGMVIGITLKPDFRTDPVLIECAKGRELFYSFINAETYAKYEDTRFKDTLADWGFFGPIEKRPTWILEK